MTTCDGDCELDEEGCKLDGKPLFWAGPCVGMSLQKDGGGKLPRDAVVEAVDRALEAWATNCAGGEATIAFSAYKTTSCSRAVYNREGANANGIVFRDGGAWEHDNELGNTLGYTTVSFSVLTGEIYGADIELNNTDGQLGVPAAPGDYDLRSVVTHELGHVLGIGHTLDEDAIMYPSLPVEAERHSLGDDDRAAVCDVYAPERRTTKCSAVPRGGFTALCRDVTSTPEEEPVDSCALRGGVGRQEPTKDRSGPPRGWLLGLGVLIGAWARRNASRAKLGKLLVGKNTPRRRAAPGGRARGRRLGPGRAPVVRAHRRAERASADRSGLQRGELLFLSLRERRARHEAMSRRWLGLRAVQLRRGELHTRRGHRLWV
jgi:hypothetical protein